jgi:hypothetical protein
MNSEYKDIKTLIKNLGVASESLENGALSVEDISIMLEEARELHERIAILQFQAGQPKPAAAIVENRIEEVVETQSQPETPKGELNFSFDFSTRRDKEEIQTEEEKEKTNQTNLLDAIEETPEEQVEIVAKEEVPAITIEEPVEIVEEIVEESVEEIDTTEKNIQIEPESEATVNDIAQNRHAASINDKFADRAEQETLADRLGKSPISSLPEAIGLNQKFLFMNDLFEGENGLYNEAIQSLNNFTNFIDADEFINTLVARHNWDMTDKTTQDFVELVERRYS